MVRPPAMSIGFVKIRAEMAIEANSLFPCEEKTRITIVKRRKTRTIMRNRRAGLQRDGAVIEPRNE